MFLADLRHQLRGSLALVGRIWQPNADEEWYPMIKVVLSGVHATQLPGNGIIPKRQARTHGLVFTQ